MVILLLNLTPVESDGSNLKSVSAGGWESDLHPEREIMTINAKKKCLLS